MSSNNENISLELTLDEALVFYEFLNRFSKTDTLVLEDQAEQRVLWDLECILETILTEPLVENYPQAVIAARERVRDPKE